MATSENLVYPWPHDQIRRDARTSAAPAGRPNVAEAGPSEAAPAAAAPAAAAPADLPNIAEA
eukprot:4519988-Lingulodinium_polyedra.AAC.1